MNSIILKFKRVGWFADEDLARYDEESFNQINKQALYFIKNKKER